MEDDRGFDTCKACRVGLMKGTAVQVAELRLGWGSVVREVDELRRCETEEVIGFSLGNDDGS